MSYDKLQGRRALAVIPADGVKIPTPSYLKISSTTTATTATKLVDAAGDFITNGIKPQDIIYNTTSGAATTVLRVDSATQLTVVDDIMLTAQAYSIYDGSQEEGPVLYIGAGGTLTVVTVGGDEILLVNIPNASYVPIQVRGVQATGTTCTSIIALW